MTNGSYEEHGSTMSLIGDALSKASRLVGSEVDLLRVEIQHKASRLVLALVSVIVAAVFLIVAMIFLLQGLVLFVVTLGVTPLVANLAIGGAIAVIALVTIAVAVRNLSMKPERSLRQLHEDTELIKETVT